MRCSSSQFLKPGFHMIASIVPIVRKTWDDRGDHMETLSSAIPAIGTIEAIAIARIAQVLSQTIRAIGAIKDFLMETIPEDRSVRGDPNITVFAVNVTILVKMYSKLRRTTSSLLNYSRRKSRYTIVYKTNSARSMGKIRKD